MKKEYIILLIIISLINYILFCLGMYFILRKEGKQPIKALIPLLNIYEYLKICELPFIVVFLPLCNVIMLFLSPIKLAKMYRCNIWETIFGILFPFLFINYIAFSDMTNKRITEDSMYLPTQESVDALDKKLGNLAMGIKPRQKKEYIFFHKKKKQNFINSSITEEFIDNIEKNTQVAIQNEDASKYEQIVEQVELYETPEIKNKEDTIETLDEINPDITLDNLKSIDEIEKSSIEKEKVDTGVDTNEYEEYKGVAASTESIAFGRENGESKVLETKNDDLKCSRCGSSLVGAKGFCPGCGIKIN